MVLHRELTLLKKLQMKLKQTLDLIVGYHSLIDREAFDCRFSIMTCTKIVDRGPKLGKISSNKTSFAKIFRYSRLKVKTITIFGK